MPTLLSKSELRDLVHAMQIAFDQISQLMDEYEVAKYIQYPKITPFLSESLAFHLVEEGVLLDTLTPFRLGARDEPDIICRDDDGQHFSVEVKGTGSSAWIYLGPKDVEADYLILLAFGEVFESKEKSQISINLFRPEEMTEQRRRVTLPKLVELVDGQVEIVRVSLDAYLSDMPTSQ